MLKKLLIATAMLLCAQPLSVFAQAPEMDMPRFYSEFKPVVGGWAEYQLQSKSNRPMMMKIGVVGKEGNAYWYESAMNLPGQGNMISKMLVSGDPEDQKNIKRMIVKAGSEPAMEMPVMMMQGMHGKKAGRAKGKFTNKGTETISTPAGSFKTEHLQYEGENGLVVDTWIAKDVSPYGLVKSKGKDFEMTLLKNGMGAKTQITETPRKIDMPAGMMGGQR